MKQTCLKIKNKKITTAAQYSRDYSVNNVKAKVQ